MEDDKIEDTEDYIDNEEPPLDEDEEEEEEDDEDVAVNTVISFRIVLEFLTFICVEIMQKI